MRAEVTSAHQIQIAGGSHVKIDNPFLRNANQNGGGYNAIHVYNTVSDLHIDNPTIDSGAATAINSDSSDLSNVTVTNPDISNVGTKYAISTPGVLINDKSPRSNYGGMPTYTGDGTTGRTISLGFTPTYVAVRGSDGTWYDVHGEFGTGYQHTSPTGELSIVDDGIAVGDNSGDADPNTDTETYDLYYEV